MIERVCNRKNGRASNERFCEIAGVNPLKRHYELATALPAATSVNPATSQSRVGVVRYVEMAVRIGLVTKEKNETIKKLRKNVVLQFRIKRSNNG